MGQSRSRLDVGTASRSRHRAVRIIDIAATRAAATEHLFLRKQLALHLERQIKPRRRRRDALDVRGVVPAD
jgi:hypothetical protein